VNFNAGGLRDDYKDDNSQEANEPPSRASRQDKYSDHSYEPAPIHIQPSYPSPSYHPQHSHEPSHHEPTYQEPQTSYQPSYPSTKKRKIKKVLVPVYVPDKPKKKSMYFNWL